jgi:hypothetical protein
MELNLITERELEGKGVIGQPDVPGLSAAEMQEKVEEIVRSVAIVKINEIIEYLKEHGATKEDLEDIVVAAGAVTSVHGRRGNVIGQQGDYTAEMVGAAKEKHASEHLPGGSDPISVSALGAAAKDHTHGNITNDGRIGSVNGKILMTGYNGAIEAKDKTELGFAVDPELVATSGVISITVADNKEYEYTGVTRLTMVGADAECHGTVVFGSSAPTVSVTGFKGQSGDDVSKAAARETWEFSCFKKLIVWKNWGVI